jgi:hypothetical protein
MQVTSKTQEDYSVFLRLAGCLDVALKMRAIFPFEFSLHFYRTTSQSQLWLNPRGIAVLRLGSSPCFVPPPEYSVLQIYYCAVIYIISQWNDRSSTLHRPQRTVEHGFHLPDKSHLITLHNHHSLHRKFLISIFPQFLLRHDSNTENFNCGISCINWLSDNIQAQSN